MPQTLGIVPVSRCEGLALVEFGRDPLFASAVRCADRVGDTTVVLTAPQRRGRFRRALRSRRVAYDVLASAVDDEALRAQISSHDVVVVHDPLCPLTPVDFVERLVTRAGDGEVVAAVRPVVDTLKATASHTVCGTVDREQLRIVTAPVVAPGPVIDRLCAEHGADVLGTASGLVEALRATGPVTFETAPASARRIEDHTALALMMSVDAVGHRLRER